MEMTAATATDVGHVRETNEDSAHVGRSLYAVADGLGGHAAGEVASRIAVETVAELEGTVSGADPADRSAALADVIRRANRAVHDAARRDPARHGMGTTLTAATVEQGALLLAHVGDSRAYLLRDGQARQLTTDHATGPFTLTRVVGLDPDVDVDTYDPVPLQPGDLVLLCTDGLTAVVGDDELAGLVEGRGAQDAADALVGETLRRGAPDNVAVVVLVISA
jgi:PPM family protein phosphatase